MTRHEACPACGTQVVPANMAAHREGKTCQNHVLRERRRAEGWVEIGSLSMDVFGRLPPEVSRDEFHHFAPSERPALMGHSRPFVPAWVAAVVRLRVLVGPAAAAEVLEVLRTRRPKVHARVALLDELGGPEAVMADLNARPELGLRLTPCVWPPVGG